MQDHDETLETGVQNFEHNIPQHVYINLQPRFTSLPITAPHLEVNLPENPTLQPQPNRVVIKLKNNGRLKVNEDDPQPGYELKSVDFNKKTGIESMEWQGKVYSGADLLTKRQQLLEQFFEMMLGGKETAAQLRQVNEASGLKKGGYLYRAIDKYELQSLEREGCKEVSYLDPSANFESEEMFNSGHSQVKYYAAKGEQDYSGHIIRWKIEHPLLYRRAGLNPPRVQPMFSHYLPQTIEISQDGGKTFMPMPFSMERK